jgi:hypothetical protein
VIWRVKLTSGLAGEWIKSLFCHLSLLSSLLINSVDKTLSIYHSFVKICPKGMRVRKHNESIVWSSKGWNFSPRVTIVKLFCTSQLLQVFKKLFTAHVRLILNSCLQAASDSFIILFEEAESFSWALSAFRCLIEHSKDWSSKLLAEGKKTLLLLLTFHDTQSQFHCLPESPFVIFLMLRLTVEFSIFLSSQPSRATW